MSLYPKQLRASILMTGLLVLALTLEDVHAKRSFKFNIFGGGKTSSLPRLSTSHLPPSIPNFHLDTVGLSYRGRPHSQPSVPDLPIGWNVPMKTQAPLGGIHTNTYDRPPAYNKSGATQSLSGEGDSFGSRRFVIGSNSQPLDPIYERQLTYNSASKSVATQAQRNRKRKRIGRRKGIGRKSQPGKCATSSSSDFDFDELFTGIENTVRDISTDKNETLPAETVHYPEATQRSGLGLGALGHSLTPTHNREVELDEGKGGEDKNVSIPTTSALGLDETVTTTEGTQEASTFWLPVASSAPARITRDIFTNSLPHPNDPFRIAEQLFGNVSIISVIITLLVRF